MLRPALIALIAAATAGCTAPTSPRGALLVLPVKQTTTASVTTAAAAPHAVSRLTGRVTAPVELAEVTRNVKDGLVVGTPLKVIDAVTMKVVRTDVTYYDGSFQIDLPMPDGPRALLLAVDLVEDKTGRTLTLEAPLRLDKGQAIVGELAITPATTTLVALYRALAAQSSAKTGDFPGMVAATSPEVLSSFEVLMTRHLAVTRARSLSSLEGAIGEVVKRSAKR